MIHCDDDDVAVLDFGRIVWAWFVDAGAMNKMLYQFTYYTVMYWKFRKYFWKNHNGGEFSQGLIKLITKSIIYPHYIQLRQN